MTQSDTWQPSDIDNAGPEADNAAPKRRGRPLSLDSGSGESSVTREAQGRSVTSGVMTLDRDSGAKAPDSQPAPDVQARLREAAENCIKFYDSWRSGNDGETQLTNGLHELRRVLARIEIEMAASHADEGAQRAIPIPLHRAHKHGDDSKR